jgi:hypothetical protein
MLVVLSNIVRNKEKIGIFGYSTGKKCYCYKLTGSKTIYLNSYTISYQQEAKQYVEKKF